MLAIRKAVPDDIPEILQLIRDLAEYERAPQEAVATAEDLLCYGWGPEPRFNCVIAEWNNRPAAFALYFYIYSTWSGRPGLYLEDLFVRPEFRGKGIGKALLANLAQIALREDCSRVQWQVLDWNTPALDFYKSLGAEIMTEWLTMRISGEALQRLAKTGCLEPGVNWSDRE